eukprot:scaffold43576_cov14-Tisochrysis_lutea.AAC.1
MAAALGISRFPAETDGHVELGCYFQLMDVRSNIMDPVGTFHMLALTAKAGSRVANKTFIST